MKLKRFRVTNFRSVDESGWIESDGVTALIGTNESGKTNLLLPLWKLHPAKEGEIYPTSDFPRKHYNTFRNQEDKPKFIEAVFEPSDELAQELSELTELPSNAFEEILISRKLDGKYIVSFPLANPKRTVEHNRVADLIRDSRLEISSATPLKSETEVKEEILRNVLRAAELIGAATQQVNDAKLASVLDALRVLPDGTPKTSTIVPPYLRLREEVEALRAEVGQPHPNTVKEARQLALNRLPKFVYYSNYGNLDS